MTIILIILGVLFFLSWLYSVNQRINQLCAIVAAMGSQINSEIEEMRDQIQSLENNKQSYQYRPSTEYNEEY